MSQQSAKEKAEAYVREQLPELKDYKFKSSAAASPWTGRVGLKDGHYVLHPIQLAHVLRCITEDWRGEFLEVWDLEKDWNNQEERVYKWLCNEWHI